MIPEIQPLAAGIGKQYHTKFFEPMTFHMHRRELLTGAVFAAIGSTLVSCSESGGPTPPRTGTPAYYFQNAKDAYAKGDFMKALDWLDKITKANKNEYTERAWTFQLLLRSGLLSGYKELADNYEYGQRSTKTNPTPFIKKVTEYRSTASRMALPLGEQYAAYQKSGPGPNAAIDFPFPAAGSTTKPAQLSKIAQGLVPDDDSVAGALKDMLARGVVLALCQLVGAKEDASKGRAALQTLPLELPRSAFELLMARTLHEAAQLHGRKLSGDPRVQEFLCQQANAALKAVTDSSDDTKKLKADVDKELKDAQKRKG